MNISKKSFLDNRLIALVLAFAFSVATLITLLHFEDNACCDWLVIANDKMRGNVQLFISSIPMIIMLWFFRTHDTREAISKSQESITTSLLTKGMDMISDENTTKRKFGLLILAKLKQDNMDNDSIKTSVDNATKRVDLKKSKEGQTDLSNINLRHINLIGADLGEEHKKYIAQKFPKIDLSTAKIIK